MLETCAKLLRNALIGMRSEWAERGAVYATLLAK